MKKYQWLVLLIVLGLSQLLFAGEADRWNTTDWEAFSKNLVKAMATDNEGLRLSAMQHMITYHQKLNVEEAVFDLIRIYRMHDNQKVRQLAVVTLHHIGNPWSMDFLKRNLKFEDNPDIKRQIVDCLKQETSLASGVNDSIQLVAEK